MQITDSRSTGGPGCWPIQHHAYERQGYDLDMRSMWIAARILRRAIGAGELGTYEYDLGSVGDITGGMLFRTASRQKRPIPSWRLSPWPVVVEGMQTSSYNIPQSLLPVTKDPEEVKKRNVLTPDRRFAEIHPLAPEENGKPIWPLFPLGFRGIAVPASNESEQVDQFLPTDPRLVAPQVDGEAKMASIVVDLKENRIDNERTAGVDTLLRVIKDPRGKVPFAGNSLALTLCPGGRSKAGWGMFFDRVTADSGGSPSGLVRRQVADGAYVPNVNAPL